MNSLQTNSEPDFKCEVEIYGKDGPIVKALKRTTSLFSEALVGTKVLVIEQESDASSDILEMLKENHNLKVLVINLDKYGYSRASGEYSNILKYPNVRVCDNIISLMQDMIKYAVELRDIDTVKDSNEFRLIKTQAKVSHDVLGILQHDLKPYVLEEKGQRYKEILEKARSAFSIHPRTTDESVVDFILNTPREIKKVFEGELLGVYCDIDDTLIDKDGNVIEDNLALILKLEKEGKEIHIWTGGDLAKAKEKLSKTPFARFPLVSKYDYAGAEAEIIIDNVSPEKFAVQTGITAKRFIRV